MANAVGETPCVSRAMHGIAPTMDDSEDCKSQENESEDEPEESERESESYAAGTATADEYIARFTERNRYLRWLPALLGFFGISGSALIVCLLASVISNSTAVVRDAKTHD